MDRDKSILRIGHLIWRGSVRHPSSIALCQRESNDLGAPFLRWDDCDLCLARVSDLWCLHPIDREIDEIFVASGDCLAG